jgi:hypothetical protein
MNAPKAEVGVGDRVRILLGSPYWRSEGWHDGTVRRVDVYSAHRNFYWVELDIEAGAAQGGKTNLVSVFNPEHIVRL